MKFALSPNYARSRELDFKHLEHQRTVRADEPFVEIIGGADKNTVIELAPDEWTVGGQIVIDKGCMVRGRMSLIELEKEVGSPFIHITGDNVWLSGLRIQSKQSTGIGIHIEANNVTITDCTILGFLNPIQLGTSGSSVGDGYCTIKNNLIADHAGVGIRFYRGAYGIIAHNRVENVTGSEIHLDANSTLTSITGNVCPGGAITYTNGGGQLNAPASGQDGGNVPPPTVS